MTFIDALIGIVAIGQIVLIVLLFKHRTTAKDSDVGLIMTEIKVQLTQLVTAQQQSKMELRQEVEISREAQSNRLTELKAEIDQKLSEIVTRTTQSTQQLHDNSQRASDQVSQRLTELRTQLSDTLRIELGQLRAENEAKLEKMRETVDEKLHATLETRLATSFQIVREQLESVTLGLSEMQVLAAGVGDLKKVLSNVKTRGTLGEFQLGSLLEQLLSPEQYAQNQIVDPNSNERVDFAVKLPGRTSDAPVWLPIDSKFPIEDYQRLLEALDSTEAEAIERCAKALENTFKEQAKSISQKYVKPPYTTDFGILFLPTEGLYAEALRRPGLVEHLQNVHRISIAGPTTIAALLNSLQMGFRTLQVQKRTSEVQRALALFKNEFDKFSVSLDKAQKKIEEAGSSLSNTQRRQRAVSRTLKQIESMDSTHADPIPMLEADSGAELSDSEPD